MEYKKKYVKPISQVIELKSVTLLTASFNNVLEDDTEFIDDPELIL